jgi:ABC-type Fe3+-siderophore transport system permease subunit
MSEWLALLGMISAGVALAVMGALSQRLGRVTHASPYYVGLYISAGLVLAGVVYRIGVVSGQLAVSDDLHQNIGWILLYHGMPALGLTLGVIIAWRYWSWLLAERD